MDLTLLPTSGEGSDVLGSVPCSVNCREGGRGRSLEHPLGTGVRLVVTVILESPRVCPGPSSLFFLWRWVWTKLRSLTFISLSQEEIPVTNVCPTYLWTWMLSRTVSSLYGLTVVVFLKIFSFLVWIFFSIKYRGGFCNIYPSVVYLSQEVWVPSEVSNVLAGGPL